MQNKNGKSIYNDKTLAKTLYNAKQYFQIGDIESFNKLVDYSCNIIKNAKDINSVLLFEAICLDVFDTNLINNNIDKISNKLIACNIAINENNLFENNNPRIHPAGASGSVCFKDTARKADFPRNRHVYPKNP